MFGARETRRTAAALRRWDQLYRVLMCDHVVGDAPKGQSPGALIDNVPGVTQSIVKQLTSMTYGQSNSGFDGF